MKTMSEVQQWIDGAIGQFGDPAVPVGQIFARIFKENGWDTVDQRRYLKMHGYDTDLGSLMPEGVRSVVQAMESSRMVNFKN